MKKLLLSLSLLPLLGFGNSILVDNQYSETITVTYMSSSYNSGCNARYGSCNNVCYIENADPNKQSNYTFNPSNSMQVDAVPETQSPCSGGYLDAHTSVFASNIEYHYVVNNGVASLQGD